MLSLMFDLFLLRFKRPLLGIYRARYILQPHIASFKAQSQMLSDDVSVF